MIQVTEGLAGLKSAFEWGISEVVWQIEQNREVLRSILEVLQAPLDTRAKERRKRAERAYSNNLMPEAEEEFLVSERLNKFDFAVHISLGMIYLFNKVDKEKALEYFEKAIRYATPESPYHASFALLYKALIKRDFGLLEEAESCTSKAVALTPNFAETLYQNAMYNAALKRVEVAISNLEKAINIDRCYALKADIEPMFDSIREYVNSFLEKLNDNVKNSCLILVRDFDASIKNINDIVSSIASDRQEFVLDTFQSELSKVKQLLDRNSYYDILYAREALKALGSKGDNYLDRSFRVRR